MITVKPMTPGSIEPSAWVCSHLHQIKPGGTVLDYACGSGRHALYLAKQGFKVHAIDRDQTALTELARVATEQQLPITTQVLDLETGVSPVPQLGRYDAVLVTNYLYRPYLMDLCDLLNPDGVLIYETFALGNERFGKPSNPDFLLKPNELLAFSQKMRILAFEDLLIDDPKPACVQRVCAIPLQSRP